MHPVVFPDPQGPMINFTAEVLSIMNFSIVGGTL